MGRFAGRDRIRKTIIGSAVLLAVYLLKSFYRDADVEDLTWIIGPIARLTETVSDLSFTYESGYGWVDPEHNVVIAPVCAGVNFLIISFCMAAFLVLRKKTTSSIPLITGVFIAALASYVLTVIANTMRITLSVSLYNLNIYSEWLTPEMLHRICGTVIYYSFLCIYYYMSLLFITGSKSEDGVRGIQGSTSPLLFAPLFWYVLFSVGVPFANSAFKNNPELFVTHACSVVALSFLISLIFIKIWRV